ncbi:MAG: hypothetical protein EXX96DRAFT_583120 [Benjaminiella poitrasii]|nr:MAG: hypothetical protein EXX96DRAFT_583120 [Benjaminiella poitrasii]
MDSPFINVPIPGPYIRLDIVSLTLVYLCAVFIDYYLYCRTTIPYQKYKKWHRLFHLMLPIVFAPNIHALSTSFTSFPWFIASVGAYSSELYKQKHRKDPDALPQSFKDWMKSIVVEGVMEDTSRQPNNGVTNVTTKKVRLEGLKRSAIDITMIILANRFLNPLLLEDPRIVLTMPWYSFRCIYHVILIGFKGYVLMTSNDLALAVSQIITGARTFSVFNFPFLSTSLRDFWGNRWNMIVRNMFHKQIFSKRALTTEKGTSTSWERDLKGLRIFCISGLMHEAIMMIVHRQIHLEQWAFFMVQGIAIYFQLKVIPKALRERVPHFLSNILTIMFLGCTGKLFLASFIRAKEYRQILGKHSYI